MPITPTLEGAVIPLLFWVAVVCLLILADTLLKKYQQRRTERARRP